MDIKSKSFQLIQKYWYKELEKSGFIDIEDVAEDTLKNFSLCLARKETPSHNTKYHANITRVQYNYLYYAMCRRFQHLPEYDHAVKNNPKHRRIWELYSEGITYPLIAKDVGMSYEGIKWVLRKLIPIMKEAHQRDAQSDND